ncbi:MAG: rubrerythrin [Gluconacetobacter diazotrophicus]|nr:rubrerythrin [Gluconacetobacter diazotrophicus]
MTRSFSELSEQDVLALAISNEEEDGRTYADFAQALRDTYPDSARVFDEMAEEESGHRRALIDLYVRRFGEHIPQIRRQDIRGAPRYKAPFQVIPRGVDAMRRQARQMEADASRFYLQAAARAADAGARRLLGDLAAAEAVHVQTAGSIEDRHLHSDARARKDEEARRRLVLQVVQPGLVGLMDGSVSTLAPVFAAAFATHDTHDTFLVGLAASIGAGISMGFAEALADDGKLSGRGAPLLRGLVCGLMTTAGGIGHTLPYLIPAFWTATAVAACAVVLELAAIAFIQFRYMDTPIPSALAKVMLGGALVLAAGALIGNA